jgi:glycosyltransferase involved in cell wall biosynthesis
MRVSIIITNYNYCDFLARAIDSALEQDWPDKEIIVVDDGSTDGSAEIIRNYGESITAVFKPNGGQCSAANEGFAASHGDIVIFLDSDDYLLKGAVMALAMPMAEDPSTAKCQGYLMAVDRDGKPTGETIPKKLSPSGNYRDRTIQDGPDACRVAYTSGNAWARWFLGQVMPLPVHEVRQIGVDALLNPVSTLFGRTESVEKAVAAYRIHGGNQGPVSTTFTEESLRLRATMSEVAREHLFDWITRLDYEIPAQARRRWVRGWRHRLLDFSLKTLRGLPGRDNFPALIMSPFYSCHTSGVKALYIAASLVLVRLLPQKHSLSLARRLLKLKTPES